MTFNYGDSALSLRDVEKFLGDLKMDWDAGIPEPLWDNAGAVVNLALQLVEKIQRLHAGVP